MHGYCDIFLQIVLKQTLTEAHVYMPCHQGAKFEHFDISKAVYHTFSLSAASYTFNGEVIKFSHIRVKN